MELGEKAIVATKSRDKRERIKRGLIVSQSPASRRAVFVTHTIVPRRTIKRYFIRVFGQEVEVQEHELRYCVGTEVIVKEY